MGEIKDLGVINGIRIYHDEYHPDKQLTIKFNDKGTKISYIISRYTDLEMFDGLKEHPNFIIPRPKKFKS